MKKNKNGFTLAEVLLSMMIIGVIMALSVGSIKSVKSSYTTLAYFAHKNIVDMVGVLFAGAFTTLDKEKISCVYGTEYAWGKKCSLKDKNGQGYYYKEKANQRTIDQLEYNNAALQPVVTHCKLNNSSRPGYGKIVNILKSDNEQYASLSDCDKREDNFDETSYNLFCKSLIGLTNNSGKTGCGEEGKPALFDVSIAALPYDSERKEPVLTNIDSKFDSPNFTLTNGMRVYISKWKFDSENVSPDYGFRVIGVDLNGKGGPNKSYDGSQQPSDLVTFLVLDNGEVYPLGLAADNLVDKKGRNIQYINAKVKGYQFNDKKSDGSRWERSTTPSECKTSSIADKYKCNVGVVAVKNPNKIIDGNQIANFTYRQALCTANEDVAYKNYCKNTTAMIMPKDDNCPPASSKTTGYDSCLVETVKPVFRYNF